MEFDPKGVFSFRTEGESRKNEFLTQLDDVRQPGFLPCLEKPTQNAGMKPTSWNSIPRVLLRFAPMGKVEKTRSERHHFEWAFPSRAKSRVDERRPIAFKTRFFDFPHQGETKKPPWDRIPLGRFHTTILSGLFEAGQ